MPTQCFQVVFGDASQMIPFLVLETAAVSYKAVLPINTVTFRGRYAGVNELNCMIALANLLPGC